MKNKFMQCHSEICRGKTFFILINDLLVFYLCRNCEKIYILDYDNYKKEFILKEVEKI